MRQFASLGGKGKANNDGVACVMAQMIVNVNLIEEQEVGKTEASPMSMAATFLVGLGVQPEQMHSRAALWDLKRKVDPRECLGCVVAENSQTTTTSG